MTKPDTSDTPTDTAVESDVSTPAIDDGATVEASEDQLHIEVDTSTDAEEESIDAIDDDEEGDADDDAADDEAGVDEDAAGDFDLGDIEPPVDPRLATVEGSSGLDASAPDPRLLTETPHEPEPMVVGPTVEDLQAELARVNDQLAFAHGSYQATLARLQRTEDASARIADSLADEMTHRAKTEEALQLSQAALLEVSMKASMLDGQLQTTQTELARLQREFAALNTRHIFQVIPAYKDGQKRDTRVYVLADNAADAIQRLDKSGVLDGGEIDNITKTSQRLVITT